MKLILRALLVSAAFSASSSQATMCYSAQQKLQFADASLEIGQAYASKKGNLMALAADATLNNIQFQVHTKVTYSRSTHDVQPVMTLSTASGSRVRVTPDHPVVLSDGRIQEAMVLTLGDALLKATGEADAITHIELKLSHEPVFNLMPVAEDSATPLKPIEHIVVAEGFLMGSSYFQDQGQVLLGSPILVEL